MTTTSFPDAVAARCGAPVREVTRILAEVHVPTSDGVASPHRLRIGRLSFTGQKAGALDDTIDFDHEFTTGLWAISSDKNDAGKTSLLEIIMWCLRGQPKRLQDDVKLWLDTVALEGTVDNEDFIVSFEIVDGAPIGSLVCGADTRPFASEAAFADTMSQFMMERLGFDAFTLWVEGQGHATHRWPSFSTVLYLPREAEGSVIGDKPGSGVAQRLVQLFVGTPWARTYSACQAAVNEAKSRAAAEKAEQDTIYKVAASTMTARQAELDLIKVRLAALPRGLPTNDEIADARSTWVDLIAEVGSIAKAERESQRNASSARQRAQKERRRLTNFTEAALARRLFHGLDPARCPRCSTDIGPERKEAEKQDHSCAVCDRELDLELEIEIEDLPIGAEDADEAGTHEELQRIVDDLEGAATAEQERAITFAREAADLDERVAAAEAVVEAYAGQAAIVEERRRLEAEASTLETVVEEFEKLAEGLGADDADGEPTAADEARMTILACAFDEAKARRDEAFGDMMQEVNEAILELATRFGFATLESVSLNLAAQLRLVKGGAPTSFSHQTPGEKLRLRIAVVVALLRVADRHGVGRHPGLLLIDSIGAEETEPGNLSEFMRELEAVTGELGIQTIVASARREILKHVPPAQQLSVTGDGYLW